MVVGRAETVAHGGEDGHETAEACVLCEILFCFGWGKMAGGDRPFSSVMRSARWRALRGGLVRRVRERMEGGNGGT